MLGNATKHPHCTPQPQLSIIYDTKVLIFSRKKEMLKSFLHFSLLFYIIILVCSIFISNFALAKAVEAK